ncbi:MAG: hypothetical protein MZU95_07530 [Desulfomicrobium escambiense]|nr:hypothetical protein [Desulfomicrobium escambiense]
MSDALPPPAAPRVTEIPEGGTEIGRVGVVAWDGEPALRLRATPDTASVSIVTTLAMSTRLQVTKPFPGDRYFASTPAGDLGYVASNYVFAGPARAERAAAPRRARAGGHRDRDRRGATTASTRTTGARTCASTSTCWPGRTRSACRTRPSAGARCALSRRRPDLDPAASASPTASRARGELGLDQLEHRRRGRAGRLPRPAGRAVGRPSARRWTTLAEVPRAEALANRIEEAARGMVEGLAGR